MYFVDVWSVYKMLMNLALHACVFSDTQHFKCSDGLQFLSEGAKQTVCVWDWDI